MNNMPEPMREEIVSRITGRLGFVSSMEENDRWFQKKIEKFMPPQPPLNEQRHRTNKEPI